MAEGEKGLLLTTVQIDVLNSQLSGLGLPELSLKEPDKKYEEIVRTFPLLLKKYNHMLEDLKNTEATEKLLLEKISVLDETLVCIGFCF
jgi:hypothetical protein